MLKKMLSLVSGFLSGRSSQIVKAVSFVPGAVPIINRMIINYFASTTPARPHRFSLWTPSSAFTPVVARTPATQPNTDTKPAPVSVPECYTSWPSLIDRTFTSRHLGPHDPAERAYPSEGAVLNLLQRPSRQIDSNRSTFLFCFFAQWFTDSFLRTHPVDPRRNTSNHEIDLCQLYGLDEPSTWALREGRHGRMKARKGADGRDLPPFLFKNEAIDLQFYDPDPLRETGLSYLRGGRLESWVNAIESALPGALSAPDRRPYVYAFGLDRGGSTVAYSVFNILFLREHNRIAGELAKQYPNWDDNRLFETARLINIRQVLDIVVNDYIRHIGGVFPFSLDRTFAENKRWYRTNRISIEFNLLYRWHPLVPDTFRFKGQILPHEQYRFNNRLVEENGVEAILNAASLQPAGHIGLFNSPAFLRVADQRGLKWARDFGLRSFNDYRERFELSRYNTIDEFAENLQVAASLKKVYRSMDDIEFTIGLFAEKRGEGETMPETLTRMVAYDAFTHILTNPVLASEVHCESTYSEWGWNHIQNHGGLKELILRNCDQAKLEHISFDL
ncbi:MAG: peroxidase family protein [Methylorubrum rhodinum]|uniref:peroxidase family protein n=1 Tax=Methylorubrum rhodinum TaxID=29428 RepID=UPI003BAF14AC